MPFKACCHVRFQSASFFHFTVMKQRGTSVCGVKENAWRNWMWQHSLQVESERKYVGTKNFPKDEMAVNCRKKCHLFIFLEMFTTRIFLIRVIRYNLIHRYNKTVWVKLRIQQKQDFFKRKRVKMNTEYLLHFFI